MGVFIKGCQLLPFSVVVNLIGRQKIFAAEKRLMPNYAMADTIFPVFFDRHRKSI